MKKELTFDQLQDQRELLVGARTHIENGDQRYVCFALSQAVSGKAVPHPTGYGAPLRAPDRYLKADTMLYEWIASQLKGKTYYERWVQARYPALWEAASPEERRSYARDARLRWIDWMISQIDKDLQKLGDTLR